MTSIFNLFYTSKPVMVVTPVTTPMSPDLKYLAAWFRVVGFALAAVFWLDIFQS